MQSFYGSEKFTHQHKGGVITIGNFDGVHNGHQQIIKQVVNEANTLNVSAIAYTFDPHPAKVLAPQLGLRTLQTPRQREKSLEACGLDVVVVEPFTKEFAELSAQSFFESIIQNRLAPKKMIVGYDLTFGHHRGGRVHDLQRMCAEAGIQIEVVEPIFVEQALISSSYVRQCVLRGQIAIATGALGRPFALIGEVVNGHGIGRTLGFPTLNIMPENEIIPPEGVYITSANLHPFASKSRPAATYIGRRPTFGGTALVVETYILSGEVDENVKQMQVEFHKRIRGDIRFDNPEDLKMQIAKDVTAAKEFHELDK